MPLDTDIIKDTWVIIPAFNEAPVIASVIQPLLKYGCNIAVVDDYSTDGTYEILKGLPVHLLRHPFNLGQGAAIQTGFSYALLQGAGYIVTYDSDGQHTPDSLSVLLEPLVNGKADVVLGSRFADHGVAENIPQLRRMVLKLATIFTRFNTGLAITDTHNGLRSFTAAAASQIKITQNRMAHASQILSQVKSLRLRYLEVPVHIIYSEYSFAKGQKISNAFNIIWDNIMEIIWR